MCKNVEGMFSERFLIDQILAAFSDVEGLFGKMLVSVVRV
jgi:hypothetical protein